MGRGKPDWASIRIFPLLSVRGVSVSADFHVSDTGRIVSISMTRYRDVNGHGVLTPFDVRIASDYRCVAGMMVPSSAEVAWVLPEGRFDYWRGRLLEMAYDER